MALEISWITGNSALEISWISGIQIVSISGWISGQTLNNSKEQTYNYFRKNWESVLSSLERPDTLTITPDMKSLIRKGIPINLRQLHIHHLKYTLNQKLP